MSEIKPSQDFQRFLTEGKFMIQRAPGSGQHVFYPRIAEPGTGEPLIWVEASGAGTVYARTVITPRPPREPYNVCIIELDEGPRMMSRVENLPPDQVQIGMKVRARIADENGTPLVVFDPA